MFFLLEGQGTRFTLYINGKELSTVSVDTKVQMLPGLFLGHGSVEAFEEPFEGSVDEV